MSQNITNANFSFLPDKTTANKIEFEGEISTGEKKCRRIAFDALQGLPNAKDFWIRARPHKSRLSFLPKGRWIELEKSDNTRVQVNQKSLCKRLHIPKKDLKSLISDDGVIQKDALEQHLKSLASESMTNNLHALENEFMKAITTEDAGAKEEKLNNLLSKAQELSKAAVNTRGLSEHLRLTDQIRAEISFGVLEGRFKDTLEISDEHKQVEALHHLEIEAVEVLSKHSNPLIKQLHGEITVNLIACETKIYKALSDRFDAAHKLTDLSKRKQALATCQRDTLQHLNRWGARGVPPPLLKPLHQQLQSLFMLGPIQVPDRFWKQDAIQLQKELTKLYNHNLDQAKLAANVLGDGRFSGKKIQDVDGTLDDAEGLWEQQSVMEFMGALQEFRADLAARHQNLGSLDELLEEYQGMGCAAFLIDAQRYSRSDKQSAKVREIASSLFTDLVNQVATNQRKRVGWILNVGDHFVPIRVERIENSPNLRISLYNLGDGLEQFQASHNFGPGFDRWVNEVRLGDKGEDAVNGGLECSPDFLKNNLNNLAKSVVGATYGADSDYKSLVRTFRTHPDTGKSKRKSMLIQKQQTMGNCTCRGLLAMTKKGFDRLGIPSEEFKAFKAILERRQLRRLEEVMGTRVKTIAPPTTDQTLSLEDVYTICWTKHFGQSAKGAERAHDDEEKGLIKLPIPSSSEKDSITLTLDALFQDKKRVILSASAGTDADTQYYELPGWGTDIQFERDEDNFYLVNSTDKEIQLVFMKNKGNRPLSPGERIEVTPNLRRIEVNDVKLVMNSKWEA